MLAIRSDVIFTERTQHTLNSMFGKLRDQIASYIGHNFDKICNGYVHPLQKVRKAVFHVYRAVEKLGNKMSLYRHQYIPPDSVYFLADKLGSFPKPVNDGDWEISHQDHPFKVVCQYGENGYLFRLIEYNVVGGCRFSSPLPEGIITFIFLKYTYDNNTYTLIDDSSNESLDEQDEPEETNEEKEYTEEDEKKHEEMVNNIVGPSVSFATCNTQKSTSVDTGSSVAESNSTEVLSTSSDDDFTDSDVDYDVPSTVQ